MEPYDQPTDLFLEEPAVYAGFWERFGAAFIDGIILVVIGLVLRLVLNAPRSTYFGAANYIGIVVNWLYYALQESGPGGATVGKRALGIKVTAVEGGRIGFGQATGRYFAKILFVFLLLIDNLITGQPTGSSSGKLLALLLLLVGYLMMLWDDKKQALHDKLAGTLVIKAQA